MKNPKFFLFIVGIVSLFLLLFDLPSTVQINGKSVSPSNLNLNIGSVHIQRNFDYRLGLDLQGGTRVSYKVDMEKIPESDRDRAFEGARNIIERRVNFFGVTEPTIQTLKLPAEYRIAVELPGLSNEEEAINVIGKTAQLTFWEQGPEVEASPSADLPIGLTIFLGNNPLITNLSGKDLKSSQVVFDNTTGGSPQVQLSFTPEGSKIFAQITKRNIGKPLAIVLDNQVVEAPTVNQEIVQGTAVISGNFTPDTAKALAIQLNSGALPAPLEIISQSTVGPSLGIESLQKSLFAGAIGFIAVIIFMSYLYRKEGVLASVALILYTIITLAIFKFIPITLTLAGIAGFILSIGMAVDANILIFERMREELRAGRTKEVAQRLGFTRAWSSIKDSNISSLITCAILFYFGSGMIRGFALALAVGILVSMFSAIVITRNLLKVFDSK